MIRTTIITSALAFSLMAPTLAITDAQAFAATIDPFVAGIQVAANPAKFIGKHVALDCRVLGSSKTSEQSRTSWFSQNRLSWFNADCGYPTAVLVDNRSHVSVHADQYVRILGVVQSPIIGITPQGDHMHFASVQAFFLQ